MAYTKKSEKDQLVKLREREMSSGKTSLYLDYLKNGKRERETLGLFLVKAKTPEQREANQQVMIEAESIRNKREQEVLSGKFLGETI